MAPTATVNVTALINRGIGRYQLRLIAICFFISLVDGLDSQIMSVTGPIMARDLQLPPGALGPLLSASQWGSLIGAFLIGFFADSWGRRRTLLACALVFTVGTLATAWADSFTTLFALRIFTGLGIGGAVPCFFALAAEYAPESKRAGVVAIILGAIPCGGMLAGLLGAGLLNTFDWHTVYKVCGALSILVSLLIYFSLPESLSFMIARGYDASVIRAVLAKLAPNEPISSATHFSIDEEIRKEAPVRHLFTESRGLLTALLWIALFVNYLVLIATLVWTPTLMKQTGMSIAQGSLVLTFNNVGSIIGILIASQLFDRYRSSLFPLISALFLAGALATILAGYSAPNFVQVCIFSALAGSFLSAGMSGLYGLSALVYPTFMRSTGIGWASGFGRFGASTGPVFVGMLFAASWTTSNIMLLLGIVALVNVVCVLTMRLLIRRPNNASVAAPAD